MYVCVSVCAYVCIRHRINFLLYPVLKRPILCAYVYICVHISMCTFMYVSICVLTQIELFYCALLGITRIRFAEIGCKCLGELLRLSVPSATHDERCSSLIHMNEDWPSWPVCTQVRDICRVCIQAWYTWRVWTNVWQTWWVCIHMRHICRVWAQVWHTCWAWTRMRHMMNAPDLYARSRLNRIHGAKSLTCLLGHSRTSPSCRRIYIFQLLAPKCVRHCRPVYVFDAKDVSWDMRLSLLFVFHILFIQVSNAHDLQECWRKNQRTLQLERLCSELTFHPLKLSTACHSSDAAAFSASFSLTGTQTTFFFEKKMPMTFPAPFQKSASFDPGPAVFRLAHGAWRRDWLTPKHTESRKHG